MKKSTAILSVFLLAGVCLLVTTIVLNLRPNSESLISAIVDGDLALVKEAIDSGVPVNAEGPDEYRYRSPLHIAITYGRHEIVSYLLKVGADPNDASNMDRRTPLDAAVSVDYEMTKILLMNGAKTGPSASGEPTIVLAAYSDNHRIITLLLSHGSGPNEIGRQGITPLHNATNAEVIDVLVRAGANLDARKRAGMTPLMSAAERGDKEVVGVLLSKGANAELTDDLGLTALHHAVGALHGTGLPMSNRSPVAIVKLLIDHGCNRHAKDKQGLSPSDLASKLGKDEIHQLLAESNDVHDR